MITHLTNLSKVPKSWIFLEPVQVDVLGLHDYYDIVLEPMDFGTIKEKLSHHKYLSMQDFLADIEKVFSNCFLYNGEAAQVS